MLARGSGKIVFVASLLSFQGGITVPGYTASKSGDRRPDEGARERVGGRRRQRQRRRARVHRDRQHPGAARRPGALRADPRADPGRPLGRAGGHRRRSRVPLLAGGRLRARRRASRRRRVARPMSDEVERCARDGRACCPWSRVDDAAVVDDLCAALLAGGISCIEITFRTDAAAAAIERAAERRRHARRRRDGADRRAGACGGARRRAHSRSRPGRTTRSSPRARELGLPFFPGIATPSELAHARPARLLDREGVPRLDARRACVPARGVGDVPAGAVHSDRRHRRRLARRRTSPSRRCSPAAAAGSARRRSCASSASTRSRDARAPRSTAAA